MYTVLLIAIIFVVLSPYSGLAFTSKTTLSPGFGIEKGLRTSQKASTSENNENNDNNDIGGGEVIGSNGRIGSFILRNLNNTETTAISSIVCEVSKKRVYENKIGSLSSPDIPIYCAVPISSLPEIRENIEVTDRINDLAIVANGLPSDMMKLLSIQTENITMSVLHFAVLSTTENPVINSSSPPPPTVLYGKHASKLQNLFNKFGIPTQIVSSLEEIQKASILKLIWTSIMWLLCHSHTGDDSKIDNQPMTLIQVHEDPEKSKMITCLVEELLPPANYILHQYQSSLKAQPTSDLPSVKNIVEYMKKYSYSMPSYATPSLKLALAEFPDRNGKLISLVDFHQPLHTKLLQKYDLTIG